MRRAISIFFLGVMFFGCAKVSTVNLKNHRFGEVPHKIIWVQIGGLSLEHLAMLRFWNRDASFKTSIEKFNCIGKAWNYNLYQIRPDAKNSFLSQITGSKNIKQSCDDYKMRPVWKYLEEIGFKAGVFEIGADFKDSISQINQCEEVKDNFMPAVVWKMSKAPHKSVKFFHYQEQSDFEERAIYYDRSCKNTTCYVNIFDNISSIYSQFIKRYSKFFFMVRDFSYLKSLKSKDVSKVREVLVEIDKTINYFLNIAKNDRNTLLLITTAESIHFEYPSQGAQWVEFEKNGQFAIFKKAALISPVAAFGPSSENFCGIYEESDILKRVLYTPQNRGVYSTITDIFNK